MDMNIAFFSVFNSPRAAILNIYDVIRLPYCCFQKERRFFIIAATK